MILHLRIFINKEKISDFKVTVRSGEVKSKLYREHLCLTVNKNGKVNTIEASG